MGASEIESRLAASLCTSREPDTFVLSRSLANPWLNCRDDEWMDHAAFTRTLSRSANFHGSQSTFACAYGPPSTAKSAGCHLTAL